MNITKTKSASGVPISVDIDQKFNGRGLVIGEQSTVTVKYDKKVILECKDTLGDAPTLKRVLDNLRADKDAKGHSLLKVEKVITKKKREVKKNGD